MSSKKIWILVMLIIFVPIYALALYLVVEGVENSLMPFLLLNIGALVVPIFVKDLFNKENDGQSKEKKKSPFGKFMLLGSVVALAVSVGLWMMNSKYGGLTTKDIVGVGAGTFITFLLIYFFMWFLPEKVGAEE